VKILLLGSSGFLGNYIYNQLNKKFNIYTNGRKKRKKELTNYIILEKLIIKIKPDVLINTSGLTNIDICEKKPNKSKKINLNLLKNIFLIKKKYNLGFKLIHFSTDQMYSPKKNIQNTEKNKTKSLNTYVRHKLKAEKICLKNNSIVFRLNLIGKSYASKKSLTDMVYQNLLRKLKIVGFVDSFYSPLSVNTVSEIIEKIILKKKNHISGLFNLGSKNGISKYDLIVYFSKKIKLFDKNLIKKGKINAFCKTKRSKYNRLNNQKFIKKFNMNLPTTKSEINKIAKYYEKN
tara:strand:+ start:26138 stop:27007 length:870 start_codon:yes stop_codon:yes gene_type:complete